MLSLLLITALAVQYPPSTPKAATKEAAVSRLVFHDRMRELWSDHIVYTRQFIVSTASALPDTAEAAQRLLRNQDEIGDAIKPYYGDAAGTQLASLLRNHIQLAGKALVAAKGTSTAMQPAENQYQSNQYGQSRMADTVRAGNDTSTIKSNSQYPNNTSARITDTTKSRKQGNPSANARVTGDTMSQRLPSNQYANQDQVSQQSGQVDSVQLNQAIAALKANGDSVAMFLANANPRGFSRETLKGAIGQHITLLLQEATAHLKHDWSGSIAAFDESVRQATQMADMLSEGIMKQFPSKFSTKTTTVSSR